MLIPSLEALLRHWRALPHPVIARNPWSNSHLRACKNAWRASHTPRTPACCMAFTYELIQKLGIVPYALKVSPRAANFHELSRVKPQKLRLPALGYNKFRNWFGLIFLCSSLVNKVEHRCNSKMVKLPITQVSTCHSPKIQVFLSHAVILSSHDFQISYQGLESANPQR